jgi:predicted cupin superfamily sugar epimerase
MTSNSNWIEKLNLIPHPEGGYYRETYRADLSLAGSVLGPGFQGSRAVSTAIYYLLKAGQVSKFHRIRSDELWHFYDGVPLIIHGLDERKGYFNFRLGCREGTFPQVVIPAGVWFAAEIEPGCAGDDFALVGCTVAPGFDFQDFEMAEPRRLADQFPDQADMIRRISEK